MTTLFAAHSFGALELSDGLPQLVAGEIGDDNRGGQLVSTLTGKVDEIVGTNKADSFDESENKHSVLVFANGGDDLVIGSHHNDTIHGGNGNDILEAGGGKDVLYGDGGIDIFAFADSGSTMVMDLTNRDDLNFTLIDADTTQDGVQHFSIVSHFDHHAGELVIKYHAGNDQMTYSMDTDGDGKADLVEHALGDHTDFNQYTL